MSEDRPSLILDYEARRPGRVAQKLLLWWNRRSANVMLVLLACFSVAANGLAAMNQGDRAVLLSGYALASSICVVAVAICGRDGVVRYAISARVFIGLVAAMCVVGEFRVWSCPHATYVGIGPLSFAVAGKRCGNPQPFKPFWPIVGAQY